MTSHKSLISLPRIFSSTSTFFSFAKLQGVAYVNSSIIKSPSMPLLLGLIAAIRAIGAAILAAVGFIIRLILIPLGYHTWGIAKASLGAFIQRIGGPVARGSFRAILQSAAAGGYGLRILNFYAALFLGVVTVLTILWAYLRSQDPARE
ncbi:hypothetical protein F4821DRAFT_240257 [Hypoxylon rubiginosum]|uniref:Uncharacterized protein n=1 Tax=Hypoxylon rubiginosum TaxID=110542 RepID=A0ACC0CZ94_9PEZI|nr:hypothetical protein F4821DRAFT_240257 [Hypoxylon rubiginosum]